MKLLRLHKKIDRIDAVFQSEKGHINCVLLSLYQPPLCSCENHNMNIPHPLCKHILETIELTKKYVMRERPVPMVKTHFKLINDPFTGLPQSELFGMCGEPQIGKTTVIASVMYSIMKITGANGLYAGTEGAEVFNTMPDWIKILNERYDLDLGVKIYQVDMRKWITERRAIPKTVKDRKARLVAHAKHIPLKLVEDTTTKEDQQKLVLISLPTLRHILAVLGVYSEKSHSEGGKSVLVSQPDWDANPFIWDTAFGKLIESENLQDGIFALDSLTMLVDPEFVGAQQSFPGRSSTNMLICSILDTACLEYNMFGIASHHLTRDPTSKWDKGRATGGKGVNHNFKYMSYVKSSKEKGKPFRRKMEALRLPPTLGIEPGTVVKKFDLTKEGIKDA